jgi:hypothetical protein
MALQILTSTPAHWGPALRMTTLLLAVALSFSIIPQIDAMSTVEWAVRLIWAGAAVYGLHIVVTGVPGAKVAALLYLSVIVLLPPFGFACGVVIGAIAGTQRLLRFGDTLTAETKVKP